MANIVIRFSFPETATPSQKMIEATACYLNKSPEQVHEYLSSWHKNYDVQHVISLKQLAYHTELMTNDTTTFEVTVVLYKVIDKPFTEVFYKMTDRAINQKLKDRKIEGMLIQKVIHAMDYSFLPISCVTQFKELN